MTGLADVIGRIQQIQLQMATSPPVPAAPGAGAAFDATLADVAPPASGTDGGPATLPATGSDLAAGAQRYLGVPYVWGGTDPSSGLDCSGLVQRAAADVGISLPRTSEQQATAGVRVDSLADARPGDLVFFAGSDGTAAAPGHVGIYLGNGQMIDAPHTGTAVRVEAVGDPVAIRRVAGIDDAAAPVGSARRPADLSISAYTDAFVSASAAHGVPATLLASVARTESGLDPSATSPAGAQGLMQLMPSTAAGLGVDPFDPGQAIDGAARVLAADHARFGSWTLAVAAYNAGAGAVATAGGIPDFPETQAYVQKVMAGAGMGAGTA